MANTHNYDIQTLLNAETTTNKQRKVLLTLQDKGTMKATANHLDINKRTVQQTLATCNKRYLASRVDELVADKQTLKGTTTLYKVDEETGKKREVLQWVKTKVDDGIVDVMEEYTNKLAKRVEGKAEAVALPVVDTVEDLAVAYVNTDLHLGQYSWEAETGANVDAEIVYNNTLRANELLINTTPHAKLGLLIDLGDTLHAGNDSNRTKSGHELDVDTRHARIFEMLVDMKIKMINALLGKHEEVRYVTVAGNHSDLVAHYLVAMLKAYYRNEPRFSVDDGVTLHKYFKFGEVLLGFHHGHATPMIRLPEVMVWDRKEDISTTTYRYWLTGHVHKDRVVDNPIARVESFRNNTKNDSWAAGAGYRSNKQTVAITYHKDLGEISRNIIPIKLVENK